MKFNFLKKSQMLFIMSFVLLIVIGTILLKLSMVFDGKEISILDSLFVSTSAVCVTGLTPIPTSSFSLPGQIILLILMQLGGIGIMTLTSSIILMVRREMDLDNKMLISGVVESFNGREINGLLYVIVLYTVIIELSGAVLLSIGFWLDMKLPVIEAVYYGIFHSISAFCNAGFGLYDDSLVGCGAFIKIVVGTLIVCGGLGFYVIFDIIHTMRKKTHLKIHTKLVLVTSVVLIIFGMVALKLIERVEGNHIKWIDALFQSVTTRTAGFNTIDLGKLHPSSLLIMIALMLIGASPGSTGGGMKTTTAAMVYIALYKTFVGERYVTLYKRRIPTTNVLKAFCIMFLFIVLLIAAIVAMSVFNDEDLYVMMFEAASALGTVGLTLGFTAKAAAGSKLVLIICMFLGRIGPFTFFLFLLSREKTSRLEYPEERIIMG